MEGHAEAHNLKKLGLPVRTIIQSTGRLPRILKNYNWTQKMLIYEFKIVSL